MASRAVEPRRDGTPRPRGILCLALLLGPGLALAGCTSPPAGSDPAGSSSATASAAPSGPESSGDREEARRLDERGLQSYRMGDFDEAFVDFHRAIRVDPSYAPAYLHLGKVYYHEQLWDEEIEAYRDALARDPDLTEAKLGLAHALFGRATHREEFDEAERLYRAVLEQEPDHPQALYNLGLILEATGRPERALERFRRYVGTHPNGRLAAGAEQHVRRLEIRLGLAGGE